MQLVEKGLPPRGSSRANNSQRENPYVEYLSSTRLPARRERPRRRAAESPDELPPPHSTTSSARRRNDGGNVSPSAFAVVRLIESSKAVGCNTGSSDGLAPLRIRPA